MQSETLKVVYAADPNYTVPLAASARSLLANHDGPVEIVVLSCGLDARNKDTIRRHVLAEHGAVDRCGIEFVEISHLALSDFGVASKNWKTKRVRKVVVSHVSAATFARLLMDQIPSISGRVLYLDADTIVLQNLDELWKHDLGANTLAAVDDPVITTIGHELGVQRPRVLKARRRASYFNAGILLLDIEAMRAQRTLEAARWYLHEAGDRALMYDQEALNAAVNGQYTSLSPLWNVMSSDPRLLSLQPDARIRHFSARYKPWTHPDHDTDAHLYFEYAGELANERASIAVPA